MTALLEHMRSLRDQYRKELEKNESFCAWMSLVQAIEHTEAQVAKRSQKPTNVVSMNQDRASPTVALAVAVVNEFGEPMRTVDLIKAMEARSYVFKGSNPMKNIASVLSKSKVLESIVIGSSARDDRAWWFIGRPVPLTTKHSTAVLSGS